MADAANEVRHEDVLFYYGRSHPLSNHHCAVFTVHGITFNCTEQMLMYSKAMLFQDKSAAGLILEADDPILQKRRGRAVRNYNDPHWKTKRAGILRAANFHKFNQNPHLKDFLLSTKGLELVEASPSDFDYGIGLGLRDPRIYERRYWRGNNMAGQSLMEVRERLG